MEPSQWFSIGSAIAGFLLSAATAFVINERRLTALETKVDLMFKDVSFAAAFAASNILHREDNAHNLDEFVDKFNHEQLTKEELLEFIKRLKKLEADERAKPLDRKAAETMQRVLRYRYGLLLAVVLLIFPSCAVGVARSDGTAWGVALGQSEIRSCVAQPPAEPLCSYVRGGTVSEEGGKALGLVPRLLGLVTGLL